MWDLHNLKSLTSSENRTVDAEGNRKWDKSTGGAKVNMDMRGKKQERKEKGNKG